jgi:hypothetical protein
MAETWQLLVRDVQPVVALEREIEVVASDIGDLLGFEAQELADAVILVNDVVAGAKIGERLERATQPRVGAGRALSEHL